MKHYGIIPAYEMPTKRDLLFFDAFISMEGGLGRSSRMQMPTRYGMVYSRSRDDHETKAAYEYLRFAGLIEEDGSSIDGLLQEARTANLAVDLIRKEIAAFERHSDRMPHFGQGYLPPVDSGVIPHHRLKAIEDLLEYKSHAKARLLSLLKSDAENVYIPIVMNETFPALTPKLSGAVLQVALKSFPVPSDEVSLQELVEFKSDRKVAEQMKLMRNWIRKTVANEEATPAKVGEEIADNLEDFTQHMRLANMKYKTEVVQILVTFPLATIERVCKLQFSQLFDPVFAVRKAKIALLEAELKAPGRELAYLHSSLERFGSPQA